MQDIRIAATRSTPGVDFCFSEHRLSLTGETYPENVSNFYGPLNAALETYLQADERAAITVRLALNYINSGSLKMIYRMIGQLHQAAEAGRPVTVYVEHDVDDDMFAEFGRDLEADHPAIVTHVIETV